MSESISTYIEIGGTLPASLIDDFLQAVMSDLSDLQNNASVEELEEVSGIEPIRYDGFANYGLCNDLIKFCKEHNLTFITHSESSGKYNSDTTFWSPSMEDTETFYTDANDNPIILFKDINPLINLMYAVILDGKNALPLFMNDNSKNIKDLVNIGLDKGYPEFLIQLKASIDETLPRNLIKVPPLVIYKN